MCINQLKNIRNIAARQLAGEPQQQIQPTAEVDAGSERSKTSIYDLDLKAFFDALSDSDNEAIRQTIAQIRAADEADVAAAAEAVFGPGVGGYGVVEEPLPAAETFPDQF